MGFMDHTLHTELSKVSLVDNGGHHSEERLARMGLQNGHCAALACQPKYKRRRVSAIRDFPPNCGHFSMLLGSRTDENACNENGDLRYNSTLSPSPILSELSTKEMPEALVEKDDATSAWVSVKEVPKVLAEKDDTAFLQGDLVLPSNHMEQRLLEKLYSDDMPEAPKYSDQVDGLGPVNVREAESSMEASKLNGAVDTPRRLQEIHAHNGAIDAPRRLQEIHAHRVELNSGDMPEAMNTSNQVDGLGPVIVKEVGPTMGASDSNGAVDVPKYFQEMHGLTPIRGLPLLKHENREAYGIFNDRDNMYFAAQKDKIASRDQPRSCSLPHGPGVSHISLSEKVVTNSYPKRRKVSAVRDFPPYCGRNALCHGREQNEEAIALEGNRRSGSEDMAEKVHVRRQRSFLQDEGSQQSREEAEVADQSLVIARAKTLDVKGERKQDEPESFPGKSIQVIAADTEEERKHYEPETLPAKSFQVTAGDRTEETKRDDLGTPGKPIQVSAGDTKEVNEDISCEENVSNRVNNKTKEIDTVGEDNPEEVKKCQANGIAFNERVSTNKSGGVDNLVGEGFKNLKPERSIVQALMARSNPLMKRGRKDLKPFFAHSEAERKTEKNDYLKFPQLGSAETLNKNSGDGETSERNSSFERNFSQDRHLKHKDIPVECFVEPKDPDKAQRPHKHTMTIAAPYPVNTSGLCTLSVAQYPCKSSSIDYGKQGVHSNVKESLRLFRSTCRKLMQVQEAGLSSKSLKRFDFKALQILKANGKIIKSSKPTIGSIPGIDVGDEFQSRVELNMIHLHRPVQGGIDYVSEGGKILCTSIVASGCYDDELDNSDVLIYSGQGGNVVTGGKQPEDQKLERGNLALVNSKHAQNPVRVIRGVARSADSETKGKTYIYDGLYLVEEFWQEIGPHGKLVYRFKLQRIPGQPELAWKVVKKSKESKFREGLCKLDISEGRERLPICAINDVDDEKPPDFIYTANIIYPNWLHPLPQKGCDCIARCTESSNCSCVIKNGGEMPYNHDGALVEVKSLVYECGPACLCPPSCYNRVAQHGIKFQLEIFKTESKGWGVRSLGSIQSGSFICEYVGELLEEKEAESRTGNDDYLFDVGHNKNDASPQCLRPESQPSTSEECGFTIDAARHGNVGRFLNHSCSPNLCAQDVLYDHDDKRIPHVMFFAIDNIPPLQELTYDYNYAIDQVRDTDGNIVKKACYCGSLECKGRMY